jgi:hypothetical protein
MILTGSGEAAQTFSIKRSSISQGTKKPSAPAAA